MNKICFVISSLSCIWKCEPFQEIPNHVSETGQNIATKMFCIITQPIRVRSSRNLYHMKAEMLSFPTAQVSTQNSIWLWSYAPNNQGLLGCPIANLRTNLQWGSIGDPIKMNRVGNPSEPPRCFCFITLVTVARFQWTKYVSWSVHWAGFENVKHFKKYRTTFPERVRIL